MPRPMATYSYRRPERRLARLLAWCRRHGEALFALFLVVALVLLALHLLS